MRDNKVNHKLFAERFKNLRLEKGLTQEELADELLLTRGAIAHYEGANREPSLDNLTKISNYFNVSTEYLLGRTDLKNIDAVAEYMIDKLTELGIIYSDRVDIKELDRYVDYILLFKKVEQKR